MLNDAIRVRFETAVDGDIIRDDLYIPKNIIWYQRANFDETDVLQRYREFKEITLKDGESNGN